MWDIFKTEDSPHVVPKNDLKPHTLKINCWCKPFMDDEVIVHNSLDRREYVERGEAYTH